MKTDKSPELNSLTEEIADIVRSRILKGEYRIGEKIKETHVAAELSVSRTPVREAFKKLTKEGLIEYIPNKGCFAKGFTRRDIEDIYTIRKALEELTVEWAVNRITPEQIEELSAKCDEMQVFVDQNDYKNVLRTNKEFHEIIYQATGSRFMSQVLRSYKEYIEQTTRPIFYEQSFLQSIVDEHRDIVKEIKAGSPKGASKAMSVHMSNSMNRAETVYKV